MREGAGALEPAPAIDGDALALDVGGMVGDEEGAEIGQLLGPARASQRIVGAMRAGRGVGHQALAGARRREGARRYRDEADALRPPFDGEAARHGEDARLGHGRGYGIGRAWEAAAGAEAQYRAGRAAPDPAPPRRRR